MLKNSLLSAALLAALVSTDAVATDKITVMVTGAAGGVECGLVRQFARELSMRLPDTYTIECLPRPDTAPEAVLEDVQGGEAEFTILSKRLAALDDRFSFYDLPRVFQDLDHARNAIENGLGSEATKRADKAGLMLLGLYARGFTHFVSLGENIGVLEDLRGLKVGHAGGDLADRIYARLGATPLRVDSATAGLKRLRGGALDLLELDAFEIARLGEEAEPLRLHRADYVFRPALFAATREFWLGLSPQHKTAFLEASYAIHADAYELQERLEAEAWAAIAMAEEVSFPEGGFETMSDSHALYAEKHRTRWLDLASLSR